MRNREAGMKGAKLLKGFTRQPGDDVAALAAEIDAEKTKAAETCAELACPMGVGDLVFPNGKGRPEQIASIHYRGLGPLERTAGITDDEKPKYGMRSLRQARHNRRVGLCGNVPSYGASSAIMGLSRAGAFLPCRARHHA